MKNEKIGPAYLRWQGGACIKSFGNQRQVFRHVASQMAREHAGLNEGHLADAQLLVQQRVLQGFLLASLVSLNDMLASGFREFHRAALPLAKVFRADLFAVDQRDGQPVGNPRSKFLHQIQRQRRSVGPLGVEKTHKGVEADAGQRGDAIVADQGVQEGEQAVDAVARRTTAADAKGKILALLFEQEREHGEIGMCRHAFRAAQLFQRAVGGQGIGRPAAQFLNLPGQGVGGFGQARLLVGRVGFTRGAQERIAAILELAGNDLPGDAGALGWQIRRAKLRPAQGDAGVGHPG